VFQDLRAALSGQEKNEAVLKAIAQVEALQLQKAKDKTEINSGTHPKEYKRFLRLFNSTKKCDQDTIDYIESDKKNLFSLFVEDAEQDSEKFMMLVLKRKQLKVAVR